MFQSVGKKNTSGSLKAFFQMFLRAKGFEQCCGVSVSGAWPGGSRRGGVWRWGWRERRGKLEERLPRRGEWFGRWPRGALRRYVLPTTMTRSDYRYKSLPHYTHQHSAGYCCECFRANPSQATFYIASLDFCTFCISCERILRTLSCVLCKDFTKMASKSTSPLGGGRCTNSLHQRTVCFPVKRAFNQEVGSLTL